MIEHVLTNYTLDWLKLKVYYGSKEIKTIIILYNLYYLKT